MKIIKNNINETLLIFLCLHLIVWTLIPTFSNNNLPLDTIEALAWGSNLDWGFNKHPPLSAFAVELFYQLFGSKDWAFYFLSQIFVVTSFFIVFKFSQEFFKNLNHSLISVLLLEGIFFYNFTTPEFNVNVCQLPFWCLTVLYCWKGFKDDKIKDWILFGLFASLGILSKYLFLYLLIAMDIFFIYILIYKKISNKFLISLPVFFLILIPHIIWLTENDYSTITYALNRTGIEDRSFFNHISQPLIFLTKQAGLLIPFFLLFLGIISKVKINLNLKDKKLLFLLTINILPIILIFLTSLIMGIKIRTMWMTPFYLFFGVLITYIFQKHINMKRLNIFLSTFIFLFVLSPLTYFYISISETDKRTDYPGKKISQIIEKKWKNNFTNEIVLVAGDEWHGGNLSYHLKSRPIWDNILEINKNKFLNNIQGGFILIGNPSILNKICSGIFFKFEKQGICMIGKRK